MAAQGNLVLADGQTTPVNKTFSANGVKNGVAFYADKSSGIAIGFPTITISVKEFASKNEVEKRIALPTLEVISGSDGGYTPAPKVAYTTWSVEKFTLPTRCTTQNRKDVRAFSKNLNADTAMVNAVENLEPVW